MIQEVPWPYGLREVLGNEQRLSCLILYLATPILHFYKNLDGSIFPTLGILISYLKLDTIPEINLTPSCPTPFFRLVILGEPKINPAIQKKILQALGTEHASGAKLLDTSCGEGLTSDRYRKMGFDVTPTNYDPQEFKIPGMTCWKVDLNQPWPFANHEYDVIIMQEVIEHLENVPLVIREVKRVLKPEGVFIFSTPNMLNWVSRFRYLATGFYRGRSKPIRVNAALGDAPNWHILPFHVYHWICSRCDLRIERVLGARKSWAIYGRFAIISRFRALHLCLVGPH